MSRLHKKPVTFLVLIYSSASSMEKPRNNSAGKSECLWSSQSEYKTRVIEILLTFRFLAW